MKMIGVGKVLVKRCKEALSKLHVCFRDEVRICQHLDSDVGLLE